VRSDGSGRVRAGCGGERAGEKDRAAARGGDSLALHLDSAPGRQFVHGLVHYVAGTHAHVIGDSVGNAQTPMTADAGRGRRGRSGELVSAPMYTRSRESGEYCSPCEGEAGELEGEGEAMVQELGNSGGLGGAPVWSGRGS
jgi:hypothetical protein